METATKIRNDFENRLFTYLGVRKIGRDMAETPEKMRENNHGRDDGRRIKDIMQDEHTNHDNGI